VICNQQNWEVARVLEGGINLSFRMNFGPREIQEWDQLESELEQVAFIEDTIKWALSPNGQFSTSSLYRHYSFSGVVDVRMEELWDSKLPLKIKNFLWLVFRERTQTIDNLRKKKWKGDEKCKFCLESECVNHLLFECPLAVYVWAVFKDVLGWDAIPRNVKEFVEKFMWLRGDKRNGKLVFIFGVISWALWRNRNDLVFNSKIISNPSALIYNYVSLLQVWVIAVKEIDRESLENLDEELTKRMEGEREAAGVG
jgi:hypothetical protein